MVTFEMVKNNKDIKNYINAAGVAISRMGYTDHSYSHLNTVKQRVTNILSALGKDERTIELGAIAAYLHDIGICISRKGHASHGGIMSFKLLTDLGMDSTEVALICGAIGNHDEHTGFPVSDIAAALIIADKSDIRRSRVISSAEDIDIHDLVNYAVTDTKLSINKETMSITLELSMDINYATPYDMFSIYAGRFEMCKTAANALGFKFGIRVNELLVC